MKRILIFNIGQIVSGDLDRPLLEGDTVLVEGGKIAAVGKGTDLSGASADIRVNANGMTLTPGLIDPHVHPAIGDWTPRQKTIGWIESYVHGGITTMLSQGSSNLQGRPSDRAGAKALAILSQKTYENFRPCNAKMQAAVMLEKGMTEDDFKEMAAEGVRLVAEIGGGGAYRIDEVGPMVAWAKKYGMKINVHFGARFLLGSANILTKDVLAIDPDVAVHVNGGSTAPPFEEFKELADRGNCALEFIHNGNPKATYKGIKYLAERDMLRRVTVGSDSPTGIGVIPLAILRIVVQISSINEIPAAKALAFATGNTAKAYGLHTGRTQKGLDADLLLMDAPCDSVAKDALGAIEAGDNPAITMVMIDGSIVTDRARNTASTDRRIEIDGLPRSFTSLDEFLKY